MYKKPITFVDYNGKQKTKDYYFNLNKIECTALQLSAKEGFHEYLKQIVDSEDMNAIFEVFNKIILKSYGVKSEDGEHFVKNESVQEAFANSPAYEALFMELVTNPEEAEKFIKSVIPSDLLVQASKQN